MRMSHKSIHEHLLISARKWARTAVDAYLEEPIDQDFAVHHMAVAVEHASKAYLASIAPVLLASEKQPSVDDLLVLSGNEDKTKKGRAGLKTIGGEGAILRAAQLLGPGHKGPAKLKELRESRNGITHMGWGQPVTECRELLAAGIEHINALLKALSTEPDGFWGTHLEACTALVAQAMSEMEIRYHAKLRQARERFAETTRRLSEAEIAELASSLSALPTAHSSRSKTEARTVESGSLTHWDHETRAPMSCSTLSARVSCMMCGPARAAMRRARPRRSSAARRCEPPPHRARRPGQSDRARTGRRPGTSAERLPGPAHRRRLPRRKGSPRLRRERTQVRGRLR
ncbi:hypothetical protein Save01_07911 [Streptomyces avermitilis]|nr:hypothetical protein SAVMC3_03420 [Streptomyces avermitilis]GDY69906.1 hypothetical protein SAV14893_092990 [Streptomyces avermitilis]GDY80173.1 hypothetical protein SAV31267_096580 [Streptomyces avermitilis]